MEMLISGAIPLTTSGTTALQETVITTKQKMIGALLETHGATAW
jgi:hypothetical protein